MKIEKLDVKNLDVQFSYEEEVKDNRWTKGWIRVMHAGLNPNGTYFNKEVAEKLVYSMRGVPVTGNYDYEKGDFLSHGDLFGAYNSPTPWGFVPFDAEVKWTEVMESGQVKEYLDIEVAMWTKKYPEVAQFISDEKNQSMELVPDDVYGYVGEREGERCLIVEDARGLCLTLLGDDVEPAFKSSKLRMYQKDEGFNNNFNEMVEAYNRYKKGGQKSKSKGGGTMFKFNEDIENLLKTENFSTINEDTYAVNIMPLHTDGTDTYGYKYEDEEFIHFDENDEIKSYDLKEIFEGVNNDSKEIAAKYEKLQEDHSELVEAKENSDEELEKTKEKFSELQSKYEDLLNDKEELEEELGELKEYKEEQEYTKKEEIVEKYSKILSEEEKAEYKENLKDRKISELKYELGVKAFEALDKEEDKNTYNLKNNDNDIAGPSWAKKIAKKRK